jgi:hypothetical protein
VLLVVRCFRVGHWVLRALRSLPAGDGDEGQEHVGHEEKDRNEAAVARITDTAPVAKNSGSDLV